MTAMWTGTARGVARASRAALATPVASRSSHTLSARARFLHPTNAPARVLSVDGVGCSHWSAPSRSFASKATEDKKKDEEDAIDFMEDEEADLEEDDVLSELNAEDETSFTIDQVEDKELEALGAAPLAAKRPKLPTSIKKLNRLLGRKQMIEVPDSEIIEKFVRGRGPGGQAINKTNSSVSLIHIPTGIRIQSQPTRSRDKNRIAARHILSTRLDELRAQGLYTPSTPDKVKQGADLQGLTKSQQRKEEEKALSLSYSKSEIRAAKIRQRKANMAKKQKKQRREKEAAAAAEKDGSEGAGA